MKSFILKSFLYILSLSLIVFLVGFFVPFNPNSFTREQLVKNDLLMKEDRAPSIVLVGGSSVVYGFQSPVLMDSLQLPVINNGMQAGLGLKLSIDNCARYLIPTDILIIIPEYSHFFDETAWGGLYLADLFYLNPKDFFPLLNIYQYRAVLNNTPQHIQGKISYLISHLLNGEEDSDYSLSAFNEYGDKVAHYGLPSKNFYYERPIKLQTDKVNSKYFHILYDQIEEIEQRGIKVFIFPAPIAESLYESDKVNVDFVTKELMKNRRGFLCDPSECVYPDSMFYDTYYHLSQQGGEINTCKLAYYLKEKL